MGLVCKQNIWQWVSYVKACEVQKFYVAHLDIIAISMNFECPKLLLGLLLDLMFCLKRIQTWRNAQIHCPDLSWGRAFNLNLYYLATSARVWIFLTEQNFSLFALINLRFLEILTLPGPQFHQNSISSLFELENRFKEHFYFVFPNFFWPFRQIGELSTKTKAETAGMPWDRFWATS